MLFQFTIMIAKRNLYCELQIFDNDESNNNANNANNQSTTAGNNNSFSNFNTSSNANNNTGNNNSNNVTKGFPSGGGGFQIKPQRSSSVSSIFLAVLIILVCLQYFVLAKFTCFDVLLL